MADSLSANWFNRSSTTVAPALIGCVLARRIQGETVRGQIVETEAYEAGDPAMHLYQRKTERNAVVFGPAGIAYVYRIYRQYHCFNIVTDRDEFASTILIRAVHLESKPSWYAPNHRSKKQDSDPSKQPKKEKPPEKLEKIAAGPGKLCRALQIDESLKGVAIQPSSGIWIEPRPTPISASEITQTTRIGLSKGVEIPWRWYLSQSPAVSKR